MKKHICIVPWTQLEIGPLGHVRPCCEYFEVFSDSADQKIKVDNSKILTIWNSDHMVNLRKEFLNDQKPKNCKNCWQIEDSEGISRRLNENSEWANHFYKINDTNLTFGPSLVDIKFGNICNLKCRICNSINSHSWAEEEVKIFGKTVSGTKSNFIIPEERTWQELEALLPTLEKILLSGGEPLLLKHHWKFLEKCIDKNHSHHLDLRYITNGTISLTSYQIDIWKKFRKIELFISIDDIEDRFEYQRYPAKWFEVLENFQKFRSIDFIDLVICNSISIFNVFYLPEFFDWINSINFDPKKIYLNYVRKPSHFDIGNFSSIQKNIVSEKLKIYQKYDLQPVINYMNVPIDYEINSSNKFLGTSHANISKLREDIIKRSDSIRSENFKKIFPELEKILKNTDTDSKIKT